MSSSVVPCSETWGIWPCSSSLGGSVILMAMYGRIVLFGANLIAEGSEQLCEVLDAGLIGGLLLPVLGALPDTLIVIFSGLGGAPDEAAERIAVGMGTLAGSTAMLLTIGWGGSLIVGRCNLHAGVSIDERLTRKYDVVNTGATADSLSCINAGAMLLTAIPYMVIQIPASAGDDHDRRVALVSVFVAFIAMAAYMVYQLRSPEIQRRRKALAHSAFMHHLAVQRASALLQSATFGFSARRTTSGNGSVTSSDSQRAWDLVDEDGLPNDAALEGLFREVDKDNNGMIDMDEFMDMMCAITPSDEEATHIEGITVKPPSRGEVALLFAQLDAGPGTPGSAGRGSARSMSHASDGAITLNEFKRGMGKWLREHQAEMQRTKIAATTTAKSGRFALPPGAVQQALLFEDEAVEFPPHSDDDMGGESENNALIGSDTSTIHLDTAPPSHREVVLRAVCHLVAGTVVCAAASDPLVGAVSSFSSAAGLPPFYVAFVAAPFASNASELFSSLAFAMKKKKKIFSMTLSQLYGAVCMNNTLVLGMFLILVYTKSLAWTYTAETFVTLLLILLVGLLGMSAYTFRTWVGIAILLLYPLTIGLVVFLKQSLGWQ
mmetsp:Transcript_729/g.1820  ORF Transcript_729/g.1820 Transcript_729/m.1820 type:complete len:605 (-) Transcript_729:77-1891(-)